MDKKNQKQNKRSGNVSSNMNMPGSSRRRSNRGLFAVILCFVLPPLGLLYLWRQGIFRTRGRVLLTALATVEMGIIIAVLMPKSTLTTVSPVPGSAVEITAEPESEVLNALSNIEELLDEESASATATATAEAYSQEDEIAEQEEILNTIVYCVTVSGARYYHTSEECNGQSNPRSLTVQEALLEGLAPCPDCNPPTYSALGATAEATE